VGVGRDRGPSADVELLSGQGVDDNLALGVEVPKAEGENREGGGVVGRVGGEGVKEVGDAVGGGVRDTGGTVASRLSVELFMALSNKNTESLVS